MNPPSSKEICGYLNHFFALGKKGWEAQAVTDRNPTSGSDYTLIYVKYGEDDYSEGMTNAQALQYIQYISQVGVANFDKPTFVKQEAPAPIKPKREYPSYLRLVVDNTKKDSNV